MDKILKDFIYQQLYEELSNVEIIPYKDSIWFIDREKEYWYFEFDMSGTLWWRFHFFTSFFKIFSMNPDNFTPILSSWVEEVLNHRVSTTFFLVGADALEVEEVLISTTIETIIQAEKRVEEVLNHKVDTTIRSIAQNTQWVDKVLNHKVSTTQTGNAPPLSFVKDVLNYKVTKTKKDSSIDWVNVEGILNKKSI